MVKNPLVMWETWVQALGWEDPLEEGMAAHSSILVWWIPVDRGVWSATVDGVTKSQTQLKWLGMHASLYNLEALTEKKKNYEPVSSYPLINLEDGLFSPDLTSNFVLNSTNNF